MPREIVTLQCGECKDRNYSVTKNKKTTTGRLEFSKFCRKSASTRRTRKRNKDAPLSRVGTNRGAQILWPATEAASG